MPYAPSGSNMNIIIIRRRIRRKRRRSESVQNIPVNKTEQVLSS
jgi:hypothetical protein